MREKAQQLMEDKKTIFQQLQAKHQELLNARQTINSAIEKSVTELIAMNGEIRALGQLLNESVEQSGDQK